MQKYVAWVSFSESEAISIKLLKKDWKELGYPEYKDHMPPHEVVVEISEMTPEEEYELE